jgi:hypothetical protein
MLVPLTWGSIPSRRYHRPGAGAARADDDDHLREHDDHLGSDHDDHRAAGVDRRQSAPLGHRGRLS